MNIIKKFLLFLESLITSVVGLFSNLFTLGIFLIIAGLLIWGGWKVLIKFADYVTPDNWTLMVCDEKLNYAECRTNSYIIPDFKSKKDCLLEGATKFSKEGFECGSNCRLDDYGLRICKEICNKSGCGK